MAAFDSAAFSTSAFSVLAFDFGSVPPTPPAATAGGGAGRPILQRRKWRENKQAIEEGLQAAYEEIVAARLPQEVMGEVSKLVKPFADKKGRYRSLPKVSEIDWKAMERDAVLARSLVELHARHLVDEYERMLDEEDEILLLH